MEEPETPPVALSGAIRYRLVVAYRGAGYAGWQRQTNARTVQEVVEQALSELTAQRVVVTAAGRTDAGVHAAGQVIHLDLVRPFDPSGLVHGANHRLPAEIRVLAAAPAAPGFHARYSATAKTYRYRFCRAHPVPPGWAPIAVALRHEIDLDRIRDATLHLPGRHDFGAFAVAGGSHTTPVRTIYRAAWTSRAGQLEFEVTGSGFLRGMVRGLVGTLLEVGYGQREPASFAALLAGAERGAAGPTAPAHGLSLERVDYPPPDGP
ncbi:MAG: tRNA pseudouridine(38-40) synthase TruA [Thermoanaerobaculia bacterium]